MLFLTRRWPLALPALFAVFSLSTPVAAAPPSCSPGHSYGVADFSAPITDLADRDGRSAASELWRLGIETVIRYYDHPNETIPCKTLVPEETDFLLDNGFSIAVVFQHRNDNPVTFLEGRRGTRDAERSLELAAANGQPLGSTIYFGVDGVAEAIKGANYQYAINKGAPISTAQEAEMKKRMGAGNYKKHAAFYALFRDNHTAWFGQEGGKVRPEAILPFVAQYFDDVRAVFDQHRAQTGIGYEIGGYGSGLVCDHLLTQGKIRRCWLAQSTGWPGYDAFSASNRWALRQQLVTRCDGWRRHSGGRVEFDFNQVNPNDADFGQWNYLDDRSASFTRPERNPDVSCYAE